MLLTVRRRGKILAIDKDFANLDKKLCKIKDRILKQSAEAILIHVKELTPVDKGTLKNAWKRTAPEGNSITVYNQTEYAAHVEYGHRVKRGGRFTGKVIKGAYMLKQGIEEADADIKYLIKNAAKGLHHD